MRLLLILILCFSTTAALAQRKLTSITINYASPEQLLTAIKPYLSDGSSVSVYRNQLVLNVTADELSQTHDLLKRLDMAGRQLLVSLRTDGAGSNRLRGVDAEGVIKSGNTVITNAPGGRSTETRTTIRMQDYRGTTEGTGTQAVRVTEGMPAYIATGITAPVGYPVGPDGRRYYQQDIVSALTGFYATIWVNDGVARISIDQSNDQFAGQAIATQQLQSEVSGALGEWLPIGVIDNSASRQTSGIGSRGQASKTSSTQLSIKVQLKE